MNARWSTRSPARRLIRWTAWSNSAGRSGGSSIRPGCAAGSGRRRAWSTTPACAPPARSRRPRSRSCCSTPANRCPSRTSACSAGVVDAGRALVIAFNKWDLVDEDRRYQLEREVDRELSRVRWAPRVNVSAGPVARSTSWPLPCARALPPGTVASPRGDSTRWLTDVVAATPPPARGGRAPRVLFATQADTRPPGSSSFATGFLEAGYRRFLERRLREDFDFAGTPIQIVVRVRERRGSKNRPGRRRELR